MSVVTNLKATLIGGGGVRTPLVIFGMNESSKRLGLDEVVLYDVDSHRASVMAELGKALVASEGGSLRIRVSSSIEDAVDGAAFVLTSIRIGGIKGRAIDERIAIRNGFPGQETTGPAGIAMGIKTAAAAIAYAKEVERNSPDAWLINFTNPVGLITQAMSHHSNAKVIGICDTPTEMFHRMAVALKADPKDVHCEYVGLNHLGWVRRVLLKGKDVTASILKDDGILENLYQAKLFDFNMIRSLGLIPTEYLFFYYSRRRALANQRTAGATRGEEIAKLNDDLLMNLTDMVEAGHAHDALTIYKEYLNRRSGSYMQLEASASSAFDSSQVLDEDPFRTATGYHRIALDVMNALSSDEPSRVVVNVRNHGALDEVDWEDVVETPCAISRHAIVREKNGLLPKEVRGLVLAVKAYEQAAIRAAVEGSYLQARKAMLLYPAIGEWEPSEQLVSEMAAESPEFPQLL
jgi:6-phospho-beta-glucosidase